MSAKMKFWLYFFGFIILFPRLSGDLGVILPFIAIPVAIIVVFVTSVNTIGKSWQNHDDDDDSKF